MEVAPPNPFAMTLVAGVMALSFIGSAIWTTHDYFVAWANLPELRLAFDADLAEASDFINHQSPDTRIYISQQVYRPPTLMLLGERVPTSRYVDRATRFKEIDARTAIVFGAQDANPLYIFVRDYAPPAEWLVRVAPTIAHIGEGDYYTAIRLGARIAPQQLLDVTFNPYLKLVGVSRFGDEPRGVLLYWQVVDLPADRVDLQESIQIGGANTQRRFNFPPLEWGIGDGVVEWFEMPSDAAALSIQLTRGGARWQSPEIVLK
jgi:hypothetical protein